MDNRFFWLLLQQSDAAVCCATNSNFPIIRSRANRFCYCPLYRFVNLEIRLETTRILDSCLKAIRVPQIRDSSFQNTKGAARTIRAAPFINLVSRLGSENQLSLDNRQ